MEETKEVFEYSKNKWKQKKSGVKISLLDLNKSIINQLPDYKDDQIKDLKFIIQKFRARKKEKYYILINYEQHYLTVLANTKETPTERFEDIVVECLQSRGTIKTYEDEVDHVDIWIKQKEDSEIEVFHLLPYSNAVEEF